MAATYRTVTSGGGSSGTSDRTLTVTPAIGDLFIVFVHAAVNTQSAPTMTDNNGGTYDLITAIGVNSSANRMSAFVRKQILPNTTSTVITATTGSNTAAEIACVMISGMAQGGIASIRQFVTQANQAATGTPAPAFTYTSLSENLTISAVANLTVTGSVVVPNASWTEVVDEAQASPTTSLEVNYRNSGFAGTTITYGGTSATAFGSMAIEIDGSAGVLAQVPNMLKLNTLLRM